MDAVKSDMEGNRKSPREGSKNSQRSGRQGYLVGMVSSGDQRMKNVMFFKNIKGKKRAISFPCLEWTGRKVIGLNSSKKDSV